jgi:hypothetical protein
MAHGAVSKIISAPSQAVFDLIHDYSRRLEWDTLLQAAYLTDGHTTAQKGAVSVCIGRRALGGISLKTVYVAFDRPTLAAVKMVNQPLFFQSWAASIRHQAISSAESRVTYMFQFTSRPRALRFILDPIIARVFLWETRKRLRALEDYFARRGG